MRSLTRIFAAFVVLRLLFHTNFSGATTWTVGDEDGWTPASNPEVWPRGKTFYAGDILVFHYDDDSDVYVVNQTAYDTCTVNDGAPVYDSGNDELTLSFGPNYYITAPPSLCQTGMRLYINALSPPR